MSKVIKSYFANSVETEKKTIAIKKVHFNNAEIEVENNGDDSSDNDLTNQLAEEAWQNALAEAEKIREEAHYEYEQFQSRMNEEIFQNQQRAEEMFKQAEEIGYNQGFQQGLQEGQRQYETFIQEAKDVVSSSRKDYFQKLEEAEPVIVELAVKVAGKIVATSLDENNENWLSIVKAVINEVREQELVKIYVHPNWYEYTLNHKEELKLLVPNCDTLYIYPDTHLPEQGCQIETSFGKIDASVDSQLAEIKYALLEKLKELGE